MGRELRLRCFQSPETMSLYTYKWDYTVVDDWTFPLLLVLLILLLLLLHLLLHPTLLACSAKCYYLWAFIRNKRPFIFHRTMSLFPLPWKVSLFSLPWAHWRSTYSSPYPVAGIALKVSYSYSIYACTYQIFLYRCLQTYTEPLES